MPYFIAFYSLHYHLVIVTKYRRKVLTSEMLSRFRELAEERVAAWGGKLIEANGEADHIHMPSYYAAEIRAG
jgi:putative transposase